MTQAEFNKLQPGDVVVLAPSDMIDVAERHWITEVTSHRDEEGAVVVDSVTYYTEISDASILQRAEEPPKLPSEHVHLEFQPPKVCI